MKYHLWTEGCAMNVADSQRISAALESLGYERTSLAEEAGVIVLNTCVIRQSAEDKAYGRLHSLAPLKQQNPDLVVNVMGCLVGMNGGGPLLKKFPWVDVFSPPSDPAPLLNYLIEAESKRFSADETHRVNTALDSAESAIMPRSDRGRLVTANLPVVMGCSHACSYCIVPYRRGGERSRDPQQILAEARSMAAEGVREITLLGQIVDRYGKDRPDYPTLAGLMHMLNEVVGLERIRFLTSHPSYMTEELMEAVAELDKVCPHIEVPVQSGDDEVLANMRRGYTSEQYRRLVEKIRSIIPGVSIATDIIVGFPGESEAQFERSRELLAELKLDVVHLARYSARPGTHSARKLVDDVPAAEKVRRFRVLEDQQEKIVKEIHDGYLEKTTTVLFEDLVKKRWRGRTPTNKLVFVESPEDLRGQVRTVRITRAGAWSMSGELNGQH
ncbi:MAG: tRNA (N6-isopentenyl adenosine(37)-C2)-methylthiotransferase MiaB [Anaerolineaceae bacterium]